MNGFWTVYKSIKLSLIEKNECLVIYFEFEKEFSLTFKAIIIILEVTIFYIYEKRGDY